MVVDRLDARAGRSTARSPSAGGSGRRRRPRCAARTGGSGSARCRCRPGTAGSCSPGCGGTRTRRAAPPACPRRTSARSAFTRSLRMRKIRSCFLRPTYSSRGMFSSLAAFWSCAMVMCCSSVMYVLPRLISSYREFVSASNPCSFGSTRAGGGGGSGGGARGGGGRPGRGAAGSVDGPAAGSAPRRRGLVHDAGGEAVVVGGRRRAARRRRLRRGRRGAGGLRFGLGVGHAQPPTGGRRSDRGSVGPAGAVGVLSRHERSRAGSDRRWRRGHG